jgi:hypothetical protein
MEQSRKIPARAVPMTSPRDYRLSSLTGYCVTFKANVPINVPPHVYLEALAIGASVVEGTPEPQAAEEKTVVHESVKEAARLEELAYTDALRQALTIIIYRNNPEDFKADLTPKVAKVIAEMSPEIRRPTATHVYDMYQELQENLDLAKD